MRFCKKGKLSTWYIGPYLLTNRIENIACDLELPQDLTTVHSMFHIYMQKCMGDPSLIMPTENIGIKNSLSYKEIAVKSLDCQVRRLRTK